MILSERLENRRFLGAVFLVFAWSLYGLFFGTQNYFRQIYAGHQITLQSSILVFLICGYTWAILTSPILSMVHRFSPARLGSTRFFLLHIPSGIAITSLHLALFVLISNFLAMLAGTRVRPWVDYYTGIWLTEFQFSYFVYWTLVSLAVFYRRFVITAQPDKAAAATRPEPTSQKFEGQYSTRMSVKDNGRITVVDVNTIDWVQSYGNYVFLHVGAKRHMIRETMTKIEKKLDPAEFVRIRRSAIVRVDSIDEIRSSGNGKFEVRLSSGVRLATTRRYRKNLQRVIEP